jgi:uncharacterized membrane protein
MPPAIRDVLRIIHVLAGVAWAGSTFFMVLVMARSAAETQPESNRVMKVVGPRFRTFAASAGGMTVLSGLILFWFVSGLSGGAFSVWVGVKVGTWLTVGVAAGLAAFILGMAWASPTTSKIMALGAEIAQGGGPPSAEQGARMAQLQASQGTAARVIAILMVIAIAGMAGAGI